jgi:hypothetical protein
MQVLDDTLQATRSGFLQVYPVNDNPSIMWNGIEKGLVCEPITISTDQRTFTEVSMTDADYYSSSLQMQVLLTATSGTVKLTNPTLYPLMTFDVPYPTVDPGTYYSSLLFVGSLLDVQAALSSWIYQAPGPGTDIVYVSVNDMGTYGELAFRISDPQTLCLSITRT